MKSFKLAVLMLFAVGIAAATVKQLAYDKVNSPNPQYFTGGLYIGSEAKNPVSDVKNKMAYHLCKTLAYDFGSLGGASAALDTVCAESSALTITGCGFGAKVSLGIDQAPVNAFGNINAYVSAANAVKVRACATGITDAGSFDMPDASYTVCCDGQ